MTRLDPLTPHPQTQPVPVPAPAGGEGARGEVDLLAVLRTLWNGRLAIVLAAAAFVAAGAFYLQRVAVPEYVATSVVALEEGGRQALDLEGVVPGLAGDRPSVNTQIEVIRSRGLLGKVVDRLDLAATLARMERERGPSALRRARTWIAGATGLPFLAPAPEEGPATPEEARREAVDDLLGMIEVANLRQSLVYTISARSPDPALSVEIANAVADLYILEQIEVRFEATARATEWLAERVAELQGAMRDAQNRLRDFTAENELVTGDGIAALNRRIADLRERLAEARAGGRDAAADDALRAAAASGDWDAVLRATGDPAIRRLLSRPAGEAREEALRARAGQLAAGASGLRAGAQAAALARTLGELEARLARQTEDLIRQQAAEREVEQATALFEYFETRLRETAVQQNLQEAEARVLSAAVPPEGPASPRAVPVLAAALLLGLIGGAALVLGREAARTGIRSGEDLEALTGLTVLGQIPRAKVRGRRRMLGYLARRPASRLAEAYRNLRTSVMLSDIDRPPEVILSTSSVPGEGKTSQAMALAQSLAGMGKRVLLVECDLRRRTFAEELGLSEEFGLVSVLTGEAALADAVQGAPALLGEVDVLVGDAPAANPVDVFSSRAFANFVAAARGAYDVVVLDAPPVLVVPDARVIGTLADATVYSVRWDATPRAALREGLRLLSTAGVRVTGLVLSQIDLKRQRRRGEGDGAYYADGYYAN
ncbi:capsular exopolysaccharide synthesis family protein [Hasllibacter halocynthiae]|uniref:non-specific protein-tyrosine kinase n=1 Tax=Hasllibacter halocynthiae TaxID=595589 RepID=A0A2T0X2G9_9RHOB|nr:Wzz/FepE/Etk N-terminal domain-containing protein [Hasllibacter halocynthiae]PRY93153.1 capsular exopolysaccharide synthesis family protein [Hasllibacter halocynthiae]